MKSRIIGEKRMDKLKNKIKNEAYIIDDSIVKVDHFINHMLDTKLLFEIGAEIAKEFKEATKIVTIEASGIAFAVATAMHLNNIPVVFARKSDSVIIGDYVYKEEVFSFTKQITKCIIVDKAYLSQQDKVLIVDDFLATGNALIGLSNIVNESGATLLGCAVAIEKGFQNGRKRLNKRGIKVFSLANITEIINNEVIFDEGTK